MRTPVNPLPGAPPYRITSTAVALTIDVYRAQPGSAGADGTTPVGQLDVINATLVDDASRSVQRTLTCPLGGPAPTWLAPGMWLAPTIGVQGIQPVVYRLPVVVVTNVDIAPSASSYGTVAAADPAEVLNGRPYEVDTTITGTLRSVVSDACTVALARPTDVSAVPALAVPAERVAEFGAGRWDTCVAVADALGVVLRFTDAGDVAGRIRSAAYPAPVMVAELVQGAGRSYSARTPTVAKVLMERGDDIGLVGLATVDQITGVVPPSWYRPYVVTDHVQGAVGATQAIADALALDLLRARLADVDTFASVPVLPAPWLEAGVDVVTYRSQSYGVRAMTLELPSLATTLTLRRIP